MQEDQSFKNTIKILKNLYNGSIHSFTGFPTNVLHFENHSLIFYIFKFQFIESFLSGLSKIKTKLNQEQKFEAERI